MTAPASGSKSATVGWGVGASLAIALAGSWLWFLRTPPVPSLDQQQLRALAAQAANHTRRRAPAAAFNEGVRAALAAIVFPPPPAGQPLAVTHQLFFKQEPAAR